MDMAHQYSVRTLNGSYSSDWHFTATGILFHLLLLCSQIQTQYKQTIQTVLQHENIIIIIVYLC